MDKLKTKKDKENIVLISLQELEDVGADQDVSSFKRYNTSMKVICDQVTENYLAPIVQKKAKTFHSSIRLAFRNPKFVIDILKQKYKDVVLVSRFLEYSYPSQICLEALFQPK